MVYDLKQTDAFQAWLLRLRDRSAAALIVDRLDRLARLEHEGDVRSVGDGVVELRIHYGPGYRVYFARRGRALILLLCGGDKNSQERDIARAKRLLSEIES